MPDINYHPILFSGAMVPPILDGTKVQTRRVMKPQPTWDHGAWVMSRGDKYFAANTANGFKEGLFDSAFSCPYGSPGDRLRMLSTWAVRRRYDHLRPLELSHQVNVWTYWDGVPKPDGFGVLRPGRFCPVWMRRRFMPVADVLKVRVEWVQEISGEDCIAEGCTSWPVEFFRLSTPFRTPGGELYGPQGRTPEQRRDFVVANLRIEFQGLWNSINGKKHPWDVNDWVWAIDFRKVEE